MGVAVGDLRLDGNLDIVKTHFSADTPGLYINNGKGNFRDMTMRAGLGVEARYVSWGIAIGDLDNDGMPDIFWVTGGIYPEVRETYDTPRVVFPQPGQWTVRRAAGASGSDGVDALHSSRGCATGDFGNDGDVDILVINHNEHTFFAAQ